MWEELQLHLQRQAMPAVMALLSLCRTPSSTRLPVDELQQASFIRRAWPCLNGITLCQLDLLYPLPHCIVAVHVRYHMAHQDLESTMIGQVQ